MESLIQFNNQVRYSMLYVSIFDWYLCVGNDTASQQDDIANQ